ncbi:Neurotrypsin [Branchiostoma belcheri]|nr:Neurotrypsin [Branchiostoma belcheri]
MALQLRLVVAVCLLLFLGSTGRAAGLNISDIGGVLTENLTLSLSGSPYSVVRDLVVPANAILTVERGVQLWFNATGITVRGALIANGTGDDKIVMRAHPDSEAEFNLTRPRSYPNVRLNPLRNRHNEGRLEIFHSGQWGTVCHWSESGTWSDRESAVACRMLGFPEGGRYTSSYRWYSRPSAQLYNVRCTGTEVSLEDCQHNEVGTVNTGRPAYCGEFDSLLS